MKRNIIRTRIILIVVLMIAICFVSCKNPASYEGGLGDTVAPSDELPEYEADEYTSKVNYLEFYIHGKLVAKLAIGPDDTYETLEPFFPTIPIENDGYCWERVELSGDKSITINAVLKTETESGETESGENES